MEHTDRSRPLFRVSESHGQYCPSRTSNLSHDRLQGPGVPLEMNPWQPRQPHGFFTGSTTRTGVRWTLHSIVGGLLVPLHLSCGSGAAALVVGAGGGGGGSGPAPSNTPIVVSDLSLGGAPSSTKVSPLTFQFRLTDAESNDASIEIEYQAPGGGPLLAAALVGSPDLSQLASGPLGVVHTFAWDFASQLGPGFTAGVAFVVRDAQPSGSSTSVTTGVGNDAPALTSLVGPGGPTTGIAPFAFSLADSSGDAVDLIVEYMRL